MLVELSIENFAIIEKARIEFSDGLNIISGETGSGKSLVSDAIMAVLGNRLTKEDIRSGADKLFVEAQFLERSEELPHFVAESGIEIDSDGTVILSREFNLGGKSTCRVNGRIVTLGFLKELGARLVDLVGQHDHQKLMSPDKHLELLDSLGDTGFAKLKNEVQEIHLEISAIEEQEKKFFGSPEERARVMDLLQFQIAEIEESRIYEHEEAELREKKLLMMNSEKISNSIESAFSTLYNDSSGACARDRMADGVARLESVSDFDPRLEGFISILSEALALVDDMKYQLSSHRDNIHFDMDELNAVESRLDTWSSLKRKYGKTYGDIMSFKRDSETKWKELSEAENNLLLLGEKKTKLIGKYRKLAAALGDARRDIAKTLKLAVEKELAELNMKGAVLEIQIASDEARISPEGFDDVMFLLSANPGEPVKPLDKVASGGEISRVMLALKIASQGALKTSTMFFDEIDTGIGGKTALAVGDKVYQAAEGSQVICITHLAQIASLPGKHFRVEKQQVGGRTLANVVKVEGDEKLKELARMLSGDDYSEASIQAARSMLQSRI